MKKGLLATLLVATGAAIAVYIIKEEQNNQGDNSAEKKVIKFRSKEESEELVKAIQEIEDLPKQINNDNISLDSSVASTGWSHHVEPQVKEFGIKVDVSDVEDIKHEPLDFIKPLTLNDEQEEITIDTDDEDLLVDFPEFVPFEVDEEEENGFVDLSKLISDEVLEENFQEIDLPSFIKSNDSTTDDDNFISIIQPETVSEEIPIQTNDFYEPLEDITLDEISSDVLMDRTAEISLNEINDEELQKLFSSEDENYYEPKVTPEMLKDEEDEIGNGLDNTTEISLGDFDEDELKKLFAMDTDEDIEEIELHDNLSTMFHSISDSPIEGLSDDLEEIILDDADEEIKRELTLDEFEEFKKRLTHLGEDDVELINLNDSKPFVSHDGDHVEEIDIINFGNVVSEEEVNLDDFIFEELPTVESFEDEDIVDLEEIVIDEDIPELDPVIEEDGYPTTVHEIGKLYPYLNHKFIYAIFSHFDEFTEEFKSGTSCKITHKVQFPESQNLMDFIKIIKDYGYEIIGTDDNHNILLTLTFVNEESKILSEIYNISNQVNYLDGLYRGYELEHND